MKFRQMFLVIVVINLLISGLFFIFLPPTTEASTIDDFGNSGGVPDRTLALEGNSAPYMDSTTYFEIPNTRGEFKSAQMTVAPMHLGDDYAKNPRVDVGLDGDADWQFKGPGYGDFGKQYKFSNDQTSIYAYMPDAGYNSVFSIRMPWKSTVNTAELTLSSSSTDTHKISGRNPSSGFASGTLNQEYTYYDAPIKSIKLWVYTSDNYHYDILVRAYNSVTESWETQWDYYSYWAPSNPWQTSFGGTQYTKWDIDFRDYSNHNVYYQFEYEIGGKSPSNPSLFIGTTDPVNKVWYYTGQFQTSDSVSGFGDEINNYLLANTTPEEDDYGNQYVDVPLIFSASLAGGIKATSLNLLYDWDAIVDKCPNGVDLARRLNDIVPINTSGKYSGKTKVYVGVFSDTPCNIKISDLDIEYNAAPTINKIPDTFSVPEDSVREHLINLSMYANDDYQDSIFLDYDVISFTNPKYVDVNIIDRWFLGVNAEMDPHTNWHGITDVVISATDSEGIRAVSNEFTVTIAEVNDPPEVWLPIPNLNITANQSNYDIDLDDTTIVEGIEGTYFRDIDSVNLFYKAIVAPSAADSLILKIESGNVLNITAVGEFQLNIPVRIFCGDDQFEVMKIADYNAKGVYQDININITTTGGKTPPMWTPPLPDVEIAEDSVRKGWLNLFDHVTDLDDGNENLTFSIVTVSNSAYITITIHPDGAIDLLPAQNFDGKSRVFIKVEDDEYNYDIDDFLITMKPKNDLPTVDIIKPTARQTLSGIIEIQGSAYDTEDALQKVELRFGDVSSEWITAQGTKYWKYYWDSVPFAPGTAKLVNIYARAYDGMNYSAEDMVDIIVSNVITDADGDGVDNAVDLFPNDPSEWGDVDGDGVGNNKDAFPNNASEWADSDGDGFGDNSDAFPYMASDWIDTDGDGYGDNSDVYPNDPTLHSVAGAEEASADEDDEGAVTDVLMALAIVIIIINVLIFIAYGMTKRKEKSLKKKK